MENPNEPSENDLFETTSVQDLAPQPKKKTKAKREISKEQRQRLLDNLKRGRETASRNRKMRAEAKKKVKAKLKDEQDKILNGDNLFTNGDIVNRLNTIETLLSNLKTQTRTITKPEPSKPEPKVEEPKPIAEAMIPELQPLSNFQLPEW